MNTTTPMLRELTIRYAVKSDHTGRPVMLGQALTTPQRAAELLQRVLGDEATEVFGLVLLSTRREVVAYHEVSRGGLNTVAVEPRAVFTAALLANAAAMIVGPRTSQRQSVAQSGRRRAHASSRGGRDTHGRGCARSHHRGPRPVRQLQGTRPALSDARRRGTGCRSSRCDGSRASATRRHG